jgi:hypothetical protein
MHRWITSGPLSDLLPKVPTIFCTSQTSKHIYFQGKNNFIENIFQ